MCSGSVHGGFHYNRPMKSHVAILFLASGLACTPALGLAAAPIRAGHDRSSLSAAAYAEGLSLDEAVSRAERHFNARVVRAEEKRSGDRRVYRIRLLSGDGRVFDVTVDAVSGRIE